MVKVDAPVTKQCGDGCKIGLFSVDIVFARIILEGLSRNDKLGVGDDFGSTTGLLRS